MKVLVVSLNYAPEQTGFAPHAAAACEYMAARGHAVTVLTGFPFAPFWRRFPGYRGRFAMHEVMGGVDVIRVSHFLPRRPRSPAQRVLMEATFCLSAAVSALVRIRQKWDVVLYIGAQPGLAMLAKWMAKSRKIPYVVNINDLAAETAEDTGILQSRRALRFLTAFEYSAYRGASAAMVLCDAFSDALVAHGYPADQIHVVPSPVDTESIRPVPREAGFRESMGLDADDFAVVYSGSMGRKQDLFTVIEAARLARDRFPSIKWVLVGDGELKEGIGAIVEEQDLKRQVIMLPLQSRSELSRIFSSAEILLLCQLKSVKDSVIPSKLLTYMAAGKPVIAAINPGSEAAKLLVRSGGGIIVRPEDPQGLAEAVRTSLDRQDDLRVMGMRNRQYACAEFDQNKVLSRQVALLQDVVDRHISERRGA